MKFIKEFKSFISRGNVIDMSVGIVIGASFTAIVNSIVNKIINPIIGYLMAGIDLSYLKIVLSRAIIEGDKIIKPEIAIEYGTLINAVINFLIVSLVIFFIIKAMTKLRAKELLMKEVEAKKAAEEEAKKPNELQVLTEILAELKKK